MLNLDFLETEFWNRNSGACDETTQSIKDDHLRALRIIRNLSNSEVVVTDPLTGIRELRAIHSISCIRREYLRFLLQSLKATLRARYNLSLAEVEEIFNKYTDMAM